MMNEADNDKENEFAQPEAGMITEKGTEDDEKRREKNRLKKEKKKQKKLQDQAKTAENKIDSADEEDNWA